MFRLSFHISPFPNKCLFSKTFKDSGKMLFQSPELNFSSQDKIPETDWPESRKLKRLEKAPIYLSQKPPRMMKMKKLMRGPETVHNELLYKGFGVKALLGGRLRYEHFEFIRNAVNKKLDTERMFAVWRVDPVWQPVSKRAIGKRMGSGKGSIHHYVTPVKADRVIVELGGNLHEIEAMHILIPVAMSLPFPARFYSQKDIEKEKENEEWINKNNLNPYTMEYVIKNNMGGCANWLSKYDYKWFGRYK